MGFSSGRERGGETRRTRARGAKDPSSPSPVRRAAPKGLTQREPKSQVEIVMDCLLAFTPLFALVSAHFDSGNPSFTFPPFPCPFRLFPTEFTSIQVASFLSPPESDLRPSPPCPVTPPTTPSSKRSGKVRFPSSQKYRVSVSSRRTPSPRHVLTPDSRRDVRHRLQMHPALHEPRRSPQKDPARRRGRRRSLHRAAGSLCPHGVRHVGSARFRVHRQVSHAPLGRSDGGTNLPLFPRLLDILHSDSRLCLVFEFLDLDLKKYMDAASIASIAADNAMVAEGVNSLNAPFGVGRGGPKGKGRARRGLPSDLVAVRSPFVRDSL